MELEFDLGAKFDLVTGKLDSIDSKLKPEKPFFNSGIAQGLIPASNADLILDCGSPNTGRLWNITGVTLVGNDDRTTVANAKAALYFGDPNAPGLAQCKIPAMSIPFFDTISERVLWCHSTENAFVVVSGTATAGTNIVATVHYTNWPEEAISGNSGR